MSPRLEKAVDQLNRSVLAVSVLLLSVMVAIVALNVVSRYVCRVSLTWSAELARYCMVWSTMLAASVLAGRGQHLAVDLFARSLSDRMKRCRQRLVALLNMTFFAVMFISGIVLVARTSGQVASSMEWLPMNLVYAVIPVSALLMFVGAGMGALRVPENGGRGR